VRCTKRNYALTRSNETGSDKAKSPRAAKAAASKTTTKKAQAINAAAASAANPPESPLTATLPEGPNPSAATIALVERTMDDMKADDVMVIDLRGRTSLADAMIIATGRVNRHVSAITDSVADALKAAGTPALRIEGQPACDWVLIDTGDIIVHVFRPEVRQFYNLEKMWGADRPTEQSEQLTG
jgi:ribosome-associated protein